MTAESETQLIDVIALGAVSGMTTHQEKWDKLAEGDAPFVRAALHKANQLYASGMNPGEAYLQCLADMAQFRTMMKMSGQVLFDINSIPEIPEVNGTS